jgi:hypothetical protein
MKNEPKFMCLASPRTRSSRWSIFPLRTVPVRGTQAATFAAPKRPAIVLSEAKIDPQPALPRNAQFPAMD